MGPTGRKNWLTCGGDPVPDTVFYFPTIAELGIWGDLLAFLIQLSADFYYTRRNDRRTDIPQLHSPRYSLHRAVKISRKALFVPG